jgi:hypothetical protein
MNTEKHGFITEGNEVNEGTGLFLRGAFQGFGVNYLEGVGSGRTRCESGGGQKREQSWHGWTGGVGTEPRHDPCNLGADYCIRIAQPRHKRGHGILADISQCKCCLTLCAAANRGIVHKASKCWNGLFRLRTEGSEAIIRVRIKQIAVKPTPSRFVFYPLNQEWNSPNANMADRIFSLEYGFTIMAAITEFQPLAQGFASIKRFTRTENNRKEHSEQENNGDGEQDFAALGHGEEGGRKWDGRQEDRRRWTVDGGQGTGGRRPGVELRNQ